MREGRLDQRTVKIGDIQIPYYWGYTVFDRLADVCAHLEANRFIIINDHMVDELYGKTVHRSLQEVAPVHRITIDPGERSKSWRCLQNVCNEIIRSGATRRTHIIALGGGAVGNLAGLAAALTFRGLPLIHVPTTLVAAFDSVLSLKQAINSPQGKNHFGTYHVPQLIFVDLEVFATLAEREMLSGVGEVIKNVLAISPRSMTDLLTHVKPEHRREPSALSWFLELSIKAKTQVLRDDSKERRAGVLLEYGHTVGHAIEFLDTRACGPKGISHGEAVALGMLVAARVSDITLATGDRLLSQHRMAVEVAGLRDRLPASIDSRALANVIRRDNKRGYIRCAADEIAMVLLRGMGRPNCQEGYPLTRVPSRIVTNTAMEFAAR